MSFEDLVIPIQTYIRSRRSRDSCSNSSLSLLKPTVSSPVLFLINCKPCSAQKDLASSELIFWLLRRMQTFPCTLIPSDWEHCRELTTCDAGVSTSTSQKESSASEFLPLVEMLTNLPYKPSSLHEIKVEEPPASFSWNQQIGLSLKVELFPTRTSRA